MSRRNLWTDESGTTALEFGITAPAFFLFIFAIIEAGLLLWTQIGLQHGAELAARCASVNATLCPNAQAITDYAGRQSFGLTVQAGTFTYTADTCGNKVSASYSFPLPQILGLAPVSLTANACFPN